MSIYIRQRVCDGTYRYVIKCGKKANQAISWCCIFSICNTVSKLHLLGYLSPFQAYILCVLNKFEAKLRFQSNARKWFIMTHGGIYWNMWNKWLRTRGKRALCFLLASTKRNMWLHLLYPSNTFKTFLQH